MRRQDAETIGLQALAWLVSDRDMLRNFCGATGVEPADLRDLAEDPAILVGVLDFLCLNDGWVTAFAAHAGLDPAAPASARAELSGGEPPHWT